MKTTHDSRILDLVSRHAQRPLVIYDLPPEILINILRLHFQSRGFIMDASKRPPNLYAPIHAFSTFRRLALEDRQCWSTIAITIDLPGMFPRMSMLVANSDIVDYKPTIKRILSEVEWRLDKVQDWPMDLSIQLCDRLDIRENYEQVKAIPVLNMVSEFLRTNFGQNDLGTGPRINSYEEAGYRLLFEHEGYCFFNDIASVTGSSQLQGTLTSLELRCPDLQKQLILHNLTHLAVWGTGGTFEALSNIIAPAIRSIYVRDLGEYFQMEGGEREEIRYLAPLIARYRKLHSVDLSGPFSANFFPPEGPAGYEHPSITVLTISIDEAWLYESPDWKFSDFIAAFPNLRRVTVNVAMTSGPGFAEIAGAGNGNRDFIGGTQRAINVTELCFVQARTVDAALIQVAMKAFPNLERLEFGPHHPLVEGVFDPFIHGGEIFGLFTPGWSEDLQENWPHLNTIILRSSMFDKSGFLAWLGLLQRRSMYSAMSYEFQPRRYISEDCSLRRADFIDTDPRVPARQLPNLDSNLSWIQLRRALEGVLINTFNLNVDTIVSETGGLLGTARGFDPAGET